MTPKDPVASRPRDAHKPDDYYTQPRPEMLQYVPATSRTVLDIGCGEGVFGRELKQTVRDRQVWGIEASSRAAEAARAHLDRVLTGNVDSVLKDLPEGYFDCVVLNDVLEHLSEPESTLRNIERYLSRNGIIVCSIPNVRYLPVLFRLVLMGEWRYVESGVLDKTHLRFFTIKSIREMFEALHYDILTVKGINRMALW